MKINRLTQSIVVRRWMALVTGFGLIYVSFGIYFWATQIDKVLAPRADMPSNPARMGLKHTDLQIPLVPSDGSAATTLPAFWIHAKAADSPILLYLHGQDATRGKNLEHAESFHQCGFHVLVIDYRGFAETFDKEQPSEAKVYEDALAALIYLKKNYPEHVIFIHGHSLGGAIAIELATRPEADGTAGLIVESTFTSVLDMSALKYYGLLRCLPVRLLLNQRFNSIDKIHRVERPILLIHGKNDSKIPYQMSLKLFEKAKKWSTLCLIEGADHADCCLIGKVEYQQQIADFVSKCQRHLGK